MAAKKYTVTLRTRQPQLEAGAWVEVFSTSTAGPNIVDIRNAFNDKYGVQLMNANLSCFEIN